MILCLRNRLLFAALWFLTSAPPALAAWSPDVGSPSDGARADVRFVVDVSASMGTSDPQNRRGQALSALLRLLPDDGYGGIWTFGKYVNMLVKYSQTNDLWQEVAVAHAAELGAIGVRANLVEAIDEASWDRSQDVNRQRHLVLLTDGRVDISDAESENTAEESRLLQTLMPELVAAGFRIHTLALSARADLPLLKQLSLSTGGYHALITDPAALTEVFVRVFDVINRGASLPLAEGSTFQVDPGVSELTLLHIGDPWAGSLTLVDPENRTFDRNSPRSEVLWHLDQDYEVITLENPAVGRWRLQGALPNDLRLFSYSDLQPRLVDLPGTIFPGELQTFELRMESAGETIRDEDFLKLLTVSAELHGPEGREALLVERGDAGRYQVHLLGVRKQGDYELQVTVVGKTFGRLKSVPFSVRNPMVIEMHPRPNGLVMWTEVIAPGLDHRGLRVAAKVKRPPAPAKLVPVQRMPGGLWKLGVDEPKGLVEIELDIAGKYLNGIDFSIRTEPIRVTLPIAGPKFVHLDVRGRSILADQPGFGSERSGNGDLADSGGGIHTVAGNPTPPAAFVHSDAGGNSAPEVAGPLIPWWFAGILGGFNLLLGFSVWWLLRPEKARIDLADGIARLRNLAGIESVPEDEVLAQAASA